jgi:hypothetical protein
MNVQRGLGRGVVPEYELAWLFKIARNVCHNRHASEARRGRVESVSDLDALQDILATPERGGSISIAELTRALGSIPERQRRALLLREFQGFSYDEIATELGVSVAAVETLIFRARRSVAEQLEQKEATGLRGALSALLALFGRFFESAAPLKLAAVTATVGATATLAIVPAVRDHGGTPAPVVPHVGTPLPHASNVARRQVRTPVSPALHTSVVDRPQQGPAVHPSGTRSDVSSPSTPQPPTQSTTPVTKAAPPDANVPEVVAPAIEALPVSVPEVSLPTVALPPLDLPVDTPTLPDLPKLP